MPAAIAIFLDHRVLASRSSRTDGLVERLHEITR
jgi:hypothetical protein